MNRIGQVYIKLIHELGKAFSLDQLLAEVSLWRGKPLEIREMALPLGLSGYCVALSDCDLICIRFGLHSIQRRAVLLHEVGHFLCSHLPRYSLGSVTPTLSQFLDQPTMEYGRCHNFNVAPTEGPFRTTVYADPLEREAETIATLLSSCVRKFEELPNTEAARRLYN